MYNSDVPPPPRKLGALLGRNGFMYFFWIFLLPSAQSSASLSGVTSLRTSLCSVIDQNKHSSRGSQIVFEERLATASANPLELLKLENKGRIYYIYHQWTHHYPIPSPKNYSVCTWWVLYSFNFIEEQTEMLREERVCPTSPSRVAPVSRPEPGFPSPGLVFFLLPAWSWDKSILWNHLMEMCSPQEFREIHSDADVC